MDKTLDNNKIKRRYPRILSEAMCIGSGSDEGGIVRLRAPTVTTFRLDRLTLFRRERYRLAPVSSRRNGETVVYTLHSSSDNSVLSLSLTPFLSRLSSGPFLGRVFESECKVPKGHSRNNERSGTSRTL